MERAIQFGATDTESLSRADEEGQCRLTIDRIPIYCLGMPADVEPPTAATALVTPVHAVRPVLVAGLLLLALAAVITLFLAGFQPFADAAGGCGGG